MRSVSRLAFGLALLTAAILCSTSACAQEQATARGIAATCANCHGTDGHSAGAVPGLAGVDRAYMVQQLRDFKSGKRPATIMNQLAKGLTDAQIESVAGYFAALKK
jgi:sulfide dehydrogenase cytochrome subunit